MKKLTQDEINVICIYDTSNKNTLISNMNKALLYIEDMELKSTTENAVNKLSAMTDNEFATMDFISVFDNENVEVPDYE